MAKRAVQPSIDVEAVVAHVFRATTADSFMGLRLGMTASNVKRAIGAKGARQEVDGSLFWERPGPCDLTEQIGASFRPGASAKSRGDLIGAELIFLSREAGAEKSLRALAKELRAELGRRFAPIEDKSTFRFVVDGRVNRLWVGSGTSYAKISLSDPTF